MRRIGAFLRRMLEVADYQLHRPARLSKKDPTYHRLRSGHGLDPFRKFWWPQTRLEPYRCLRRYALLMDWGVGEAVKGSRLKVQGEEADADKQLCSHSPSLANGSSLKKGKQIVAVPSTSNLEPSTLNLQPTTLNLEPSTFNLPLNARILVVRMGHLGDILHLMPTVREMRRQRPDWRLELVTGPWNRELVERFTEWDVVHYWTPDVVQFHRGKRAGVQSPAEERHFISELKGAGIDIVFCPSVPHFAELALITGLNPGIYIGTPWALDEWEGPFGRKTILFDSRHYEIDAIADFLPLMGLERPQVRLFYHVGIESRKRVAGLLSQQRSTSGETINLQPSTFNLQPSSARLILLFPGSGWPGKNWSEEKFARLGDSLVMEHGAQVGLVGSPAEAYLCRQVANEMKYPAETWAGRLSLDESAALIAQASLVVGNDSAPVHLAAALGIPTVSLWGPTFPEKWGPLGPCHVVLRTIGECTGCNYWHPSARCKGNPPCMTMISVEKVLEAASILIRSGISVLAAIAIRA